MKRTTLKASGKPLQRRNGIRQVSAKKRKHRTSEAGKSALAHMLWVKTLPCCICGKPGPSDAHHVIHDRYKSRKPDDWHVIPLCRAHHTEGPEAIHTSKKAWREKHGADWSYLKLYSPDPPRQV